MLNLSLMTKIAWYSRANKILAVVVLLLSLFANFMNPSVTKAITAWQGDYYNYDTPSASPPNIGSSVIFSRADDAIDFNWGSSSPDASINDDGFFARWTANQTFENGYYHFTIEADDGYRVYIDNEAIIAKWMDVPGPYMSTRYMSAGTHEVKVEYYENTGNASIVFNYSKIVLSDHADAVEIHNCDELQAMDDDLSGNYRLANNIDCSATSTWNGGEGFVPVGDNSVENFTGSLDGNGKIISNLTINRPAYTEPVGLFGVISGDSVVKDLYIANANISGNSSVGILAGKLAGTASNVRTSGVVEGAGEYVGGLVGWHYHAVVGGYTIMDCVSSADVTGDYFVGGLVGYNEESSISRSSALGVVNGQGYVGGLIGYVENATVDYSYALGNVTIADNSGSYVGGLIGSIGYGMLTNSFASGDVSVSGNATHVSDIGGLVGSAGDLIVKNVFAEGDVAGGDEKVGGLIGHLSADDYAYVTLSNAYASGDVTSDGESINIGGLIGSVDKARISDVYSTGNVSITALGTIYGRVGGLIGFLGNETELFRASSEGSVTVLSVSAEGGVGGLIGSASTSVNGSWSTVENSFSTGNVSNSATDSFNGALIGAVNIESYNTGRTLDIRNSYSTGSVTGYGYVSGLVGYVSVQDSEMVIINNTFSTGEVVPLDEFTEYGGVVGACDISLSGMFSEIDTFWDSETTGVSSENTCNGIGAKTTAEMKNIRTYTDSSFNTDLDGYFDFVGTQYDDEPLGEDLWDINGFTNNGYPFLTFSQDFDFSSFTNLDADPETDTIEFESINNGDTNGDSVFDDEQRNVTAFNNSVSDNVSVLEVSSECFVISTDANSESTLSSQDSGHSYPVGLVSFMSECSTVGSTITVTQYFYGLDNSNLIARKYNSNTSGYSTINGATISKVSIGGHTVTKVTYQITDGGELDEDGVANGVIVDPSGPGLNVVGAPNTGLQRL